MAGMAMFDTWAAELPDEVRAEIVITRGLNTAALVANCVVPEYGGNARPVDVVFVGTITEAIPAVKQGTAAFSKTLTFFRNCYGATHGAKTEDDDGAILEPKDTEAEEYYTLKPAYKRDRLAALNEARQHEVEDARLPSARLWGRYEKLRRVDTEYVPLAPEKVQSEETGKKKPAASMLAPLKDGVLGWRLPAIYEAPPTSFDDLENWCYIVENLLFLTKWVSNVRVLETFHNRFWSRVRANRQPRSGYRNLTVQEYLDAYMTFQDQWKKASKQSANLDEAILACQIQQRAVTEIQDHGDNSDEEDIYRAYPPISPDTGIQNEPQNLYLQTLPHKGQQRRPKEVSKAKASYQLAAGGMTTGTPTRQPGKPLIQKKKFIGGSINQTYFNQSSSKSPNLYGSMVVNKSQKNSQKLLKPPKQNQV